MEKESLEARSRSGGYHQGSFWYIAQMLTIFKKFSSFSGYSDHGKGCVLSFWCAMWCADPETLPVSQGILEVFGWGHWDLPSLICISEERAALGHLGVLSSWRVWFPPWWHRDVLWDAGRAPQSPCGALPFPALSPLSPPSLYSRNVSKHPHAWNLNT